MKIIKMLSQIRRDFTALFECEHCKNQEKIDGYDDSYFHESVIPKIKCSSCGKHSGDDYVPNAPKYDDSIVI